MPSSFTLRTRFEAFVKGLVEGCALDRVPGTRSDCRYWERAAEAALSVRTSWRQPVGMEYDFPAKKSMAAVVAEPDLFLFVSHVSEDRAAALEIVDELERRGVPCWIAPRNVRPGRPFDDEIVDAIEASRAMLLVFSDRCNDSEYIRREVTVAGESHKIIIPFRIEDAQPRRGLRVWLSDLHWIDGFAARERAIDDLAEHLVSPASARHRPEAQPHREKGEETPRPTQAGRRRSRIAKPHAIGLAAVSLAIVVVVGLMLVGVFHHAAVQQA